MSNWTARWLALLGASFLLWSGTAQSAVYWQIWSGDTAATPAEACQLSMAILAAQEPPHWRVEFRGMQRTRYFPAGMLRQVSCRIWSIDTTRTNRYKNLSQTATRMGDGTCDDPNDVLDWMQGSCVPLGTDSKNWGAPDTKSCEGNPVNVSAGAKFTGAVDVVAKGVSGLRFARYYNSEGSVRSELGEHWSGSYLQELEIFTDVVHAVRPDGKIWTFSRNADGSWSSPNNSHARLLPPTGEPQEWRLVVEDETTEVFDEYGWLQAIFHRGNEQQVSYWGSQLSRVDAYDGQFLTFTWSSDRIQTVTLNDVRTWTYSYDDVGSLISVQNPDGTVTRYHYEDVKSRHALTGITDERGVRYATYSYDPTTGAANLTTHINNVGRREITYNEDGTRTVTDSLGRVKTYNTTKSLGEILPAQITK